MATAEKKPRTAAQIAATERLVARNTAKKAAPAAQDPDQLYKVIGGDWGNNYGHIVADKEGGPTVSVELIGKEETIDVDREALQAVPFIGA
ncbi:MAG: hypothetical protein ACTS9Y_13370 [Methylophilus sp.]|uniref:hypothetical protein n=1 Tax=Methylophilus sp. TaxID=29541 RepID=UPI003F9FE1E4